MIRLTRILLWAFAFALIMNLSARSEKKAAHLRLNSEAAMLAKADVMSINHLILWAKNNGMYAGDEENFAARYPNNNVIVSFAEGTLVGGLVRDGQEPVLRVGGATYGTSFGPGAILTDYAQDRTWTDISEKSISIYKVRPDWQTADLRRDAAAYFDLSEQYVTGSEMTEMRNRYGTSWQNWPASLGAPYTDVNKNGLYEPGVDIPGVPGASQTIWYVANDLDSSQTKLLAGSPPIGLEMQTTLWAFAADSSNALAHTVFRRTRLIYKGISGHTNGARIDSMYVALWADPDLGELNDLAGCDSLQDLGFIYEASVRDQYFAAAGLPVPSMGYDLLQGPMVPGDYNDNAFFNFSTRPGYKNLKSTACIIFRAGDVDADPSMKIYNGTREWYNVLQGYRPRPSYPNHDAYRDANNKPVHFLHAGDPYLGSGNVELGNFPPGDRRLVISSGPFAMAIGDTQEVIAALVGGIAYDNLTSFVKMQQNDKVIQAAWEQQACLEVPGAEINSRVSDNQIVADIFIKSIPGLPQVDYSLVTAAGTQIMAGAGQDDGLGIDQVANDGVYSATTLSLPSGAEGVFLDVSVVNSAGQHRSFPHVAGPVTTALPLITIDQTVVSDNINYDGVVNPGENIRYTMAIENRSVYEAENLRMITEPDYEQKMVEIAKISANSSFRFLYQPSDQSSYFSFQVPQNYGDSNFKVATILSDRKYNVWHNVLSFPVVPLSTPIKYDSLLHVQGSADGNFGITIIDPSMVKDHIYVVQGVDAIDAAGRPGYTLTDSTTGEVLLRNQPLPDSLGHSSVVTAGFVLLRGSLAPENAAGMKDYKITSGTRVLSWWYANDYGYYDLEGFNHTIGWNEPAYALGRIEKKTLKSSEVHNVLIKFAATNLQGQVTDKNDPDWSWGYRYLRAATSAPAKPEFAPFIINKTPGYPYQDFSRCIPFSAWDMEVVPPQRLAVGFMENNTATGMVDGIYWPPSYTTGDNNDTREWFFIFKAPYSETPIEPLKVDIQSQATPMMYWGMPCRRGEIAFNENDEFMIYAWHPVSSLDRWVFNPKIISHVRLSGAPETYALEQNYPNPFNPQTTIRFSLTADVHVKLTVFNMLGQQVATLLDEKVEAGRHEVTWKAVNAANQPMASGVYFYRLDAGPFTQVKRMLFLK